MEVKISVKHINALKACKAEISETGDLSHILTFDCMLAPGDLERLLLVFKQKVPVTMEIVSPQSRMDMTFTQVMDAVSEKSGPVDAGTMGQMKKNRKKQKEAEEAEKAEAERAAALNRLQLVSGREAQPVGAGIEDKAT